MSFQDEAQRLYQEGSIGYAVLIGDDNVAYWQMGEWAIDPVQAIKDWKSGAASLVVGGLKFATIRKDDERFVGTNIAERQGHFIIQRCPFWNGYLVAWAPASIGPDLAYSEISKLASKVRS